MHGQIVSVLFFSTVIFNSESMLLLVALVCHPVLLDDCNPSVMLTHSVMARYREGEVELGLVKCIKLSDRTLLLMIAQTAPQLISSLKGRERGRGRRKSSG